MNIPETSRYISLILRHKPEVIGVPFVERGWANVDAETARKVGSRHRTLVIYIVKTGEMYRNQGKFYRSVSGVWRTKSVPAKYLSRVQAETV